MPRWMIAWAVAVLVPGTACASDPFDFFETQIRPVLTKNCLACHGVAKMGGLQLDSREHLMKGGLHGVVIVPGDPDNSVLVQAIRNTHARIKMPPQAKLPSGEIADIELWVKSGAVWPDVAQTAATNAFWSFQPIRKPAVPVVSNSPSQLSAVDRFIRAKLTSNALKAVAPADKHALLRRATFDLLGLPPTPEEVEAFVADSSPSAFEKVVD